MNHFDRQGKTSYPRGRGRGRGIMNNSPRYGRPKEFNTVNSPKPNASRRSKPPCEESTLISIELDLDQPTEQWFTQFKKSWNMLKNCPAVRDMLHQHFDICVNPYEQALRLMYNSVDFKHSKPKSLACFIMEEFANWTRKEYDRIINLLQPTLKLTAFNIVRQQTLFSLMKLVARTYEMAKNCDMFLGVIDHMIEQKQYKEACQCAALLGLHDRYNIDQFLVPLILQDKLTCAEDFLKESPRHQVELITFLDSMLSPNVHVKTAMESYVLKNDVYDIKWDKLYIKPWRKLLTRLAKTFDIPESATPFLNKRRNEGALQFLLHERYISGSVGAESWREMIQEAVKDDENLQLELVIQVAALNDQEESLRWAQFYNIPKDKWPSSVEWLYDNPGQDANFFKQQINPNLEDSWDTPLDETPEYYKLKLPSSSIYLVDTEPAFKEFISNGLQDVNIVGIDCEWKPSFGGKNNELALMQIATRKAAYVIDTIALGGNVPQLWQELSKLMFNNCDILKLGFGFSSDITIIKQSLPHLNFNQKQVGFLDLQSFWKHIDKNKDIVFPYDVKDGGLSLGTLVQKCFGNTLDKSDRFSNWEKRPLRPSQMVYAALDAFCLIEIYDVIKECCENADINIDDLTYAVMTHSANERRKSKKYHHKKKPRSKDVTNNPKPHDGVNPAGSVKLICDTMLQGLGKSLRRCGIDTIILANYQGTRDCVNAYVQDKRYIVSRGSSFEKIINAKVPSEACFNVTTDNLDEQLEQVLNYFNINVTKEDVFSVCLVCNSKNFLKLSNQTMKSLGSATNSTSNTSKIMPGPPPDYYVASGFSSEEDDDEDDDNLRPTYSTLSELRTSNSYHCSEINVAEGKTRRGVSIQKDAVPPPIFDKVETFYVCEDCGKVYWDGSHLDRVLSGRLQKVVKV